MHSFLLEALSECQLLTFLKFVLKYQISLLKLVAWPDLSQVSQFLYQSNDDGDGGDDDHVPQTPSGF